MNATVSFLTSDGSSAAQETNDWAQHRAVRVPASAVRDGAVFVVQNGKAVRRAVTIAQGARNGPDVEVRTGLIGGEDVIVSPPETLRDGARVVPQDGKS